MGIAIIGLNPSYNQQEFGVLLGSQVIIIIINLKVQFFFIYNIRKEVMTHFAETQISTHSSGTDETLLHAEEQQPPSYEEYLNSLKSEGK